MSRRTSSPEAAATISWMTASGLSAPRAGMPAPKVGIGGSGSMSRRLSSASEYSRLTRQPPSRSMATSLRPFSGAVSLASSTSASWRSSTSRTTGPSGSSSMATLLAERAADHVDHRNTVTERARR